MISNMSEVLLFEPLFIQCRKTGFQGCVEIFSKSQFKVISIPKRGLKLKNTFLMFLCDYRVSGIMATPGCKSERGMKEEDLEVPGYSEIFSQDSIIFND